METCTIVNSIKWEGLGNEATVCPLFSRLAQYKHSVKGNHLYVLCWSTWNQDQNWIRWLKPFLATTGLGKSTNQECAAANWPLTHWKSNNQELQNRAIRHTFANQKSWSWSRILQQGFADLMFAVYWFSSRQVEMESKWTKYVTAKTNVLF